MIATACQLVEHMEKYYAQRTAFQYYEAGAIHAVSYKEYAEDVKGFATWLKKSFSDIEGKHMGILARNSYPYMVAFLGILLAKGVAVPLNVEESRETIQYQIDFADVTGIFTDGEYEQREPLLKANYPEMLWNLEEAVGQSKKAWKEGHGWTGKPDSGKKEVHEPENDRSELSRLADCTEEEWQRLMVILFTSGTTGRSKGVMLSGKSLFSRLSDAVGQCELLGGWANTPVLKALLIASMCHVAGLAACFTWLAMGSVINLSRTMKYLYRDLQKMESDYCSTVVPVILKAWYKDLKKGRKDRLGNLKTLICGAAPVDPVIFQEFEKHGITVIQAYGMTEICGGGTTNITKDPAKLHSVGKPGDGCELKIEDGEICLKSDTVMMGYYKDPEATKQVLCDGWLHTGDLGYVDSDGYLYLTGRKKNLIILSSGENVSPEELELLLQKNPMIEEVCVKEKDGKICAEIFCGEEHQETIRRHIETVNRELPVYKRITSVEFRDQAFPRTASGKMLRRQV